MTGGGGGGGGRSDVTRNDEERNDVSGNDEERSLIFRTPDRLLGPVVKVSAWRATDLGSIPAVSVNVVSRSNHTRDSTIGIIPVIQQLESYQRFNNWNHTRDSTIRIIPGIQQLESYQ